MDHKKAYENVTVIFFDLDGTLRRTRPSLHATLINLLEEKGLSVEKKGQREGLLWAHDYWAHRDDRQEDRTTYPDHTDFLAYYAGKYFKAMGLDGQVSKAECRGFAEGFEPEGYLVLGVKELLWNLKQAGYTLGLVSNRPIPLTGLAIELGIISHFHFTISAGQVGVWKPKPKIFEVALKMAGDKSPEETLYIGDNYYMDYVGAKAAGLHCALVDEHDIYEGLAEDDCLILDEVTDLKDYFS